MNKRAILLMFLALTIMCGCDGTRSEDKKKQDEFYSNTGDWGSAIMPLVKPYTIKRVDSDPGGRWGIEFLHLFNTYNVKRVAVQHNIIYLVSGKVDAINDSTVIGTKNVATAWFILNVDNQLEKGFSTKYTFMKFIKDNKYPAPYWYSIDSLCNTMSHGAKLPWIK